MAAAQQEVPGDAKGGYHLKVYEDLIQLPTLVLNSHEESFAGLRTEDFRVRVDSGPPFTPLHTRLEGDDPISMALLFDDSGVETSAMLAAASKALEQHLLPDTFPGPADQLSMYALDCNLVQARLLSGTGAGAGALFADLLQSQTLHTDKGSTECARPIHLWDAISVVGKYLREQTGRRVLVVVTDGKDAGSRNRWPLLRQYLGAAGITLFAIRPITPRLEPMGASAAFVIPEFSGREDGLPLLAGGTGGMLIHTPTPDLPGLLTRIVSLLRKRYILEYHVPRNATSGIHIVEVVVPGRTAHIRAGGVTVVLHDAQVGQDPAEVKRDTSHDPVVGDRHVLTPQR